MTRDLRREAPSDVDTVDLVTLTSLGAAAAGAGLAWRLARPVLRVTGTVLAGSARMVRDRAPASLVIDLADRGGHVRYELGRVAAEVFRRGLLQAVESALAVIDLTELVRRHVNLNAIAEGIDVDAVVARADLDAAMARADLDAVIARVDLDGAVARVDLDAVVSRLDIDAIAKRLDVDAVIALVDVDAALARLDLAGIARQVIDAIDLPEILRQSTGTVASEAVRGVRVEGVAADDAVARFVDRLLRRSRPDGPVQP